MFVYVAVSLFAFECIYRSQKLYVRCYCVIRSECKRFLWRTIWISFFCFCLLSAGNLHRCIQCIHVRIWFGFRLNLYLFICVYLLTLLICVCLLFFANCSFVHSVFLYIYIYFVCDLRIQNGWNKKKNITNFNMRFLAAENLLITVNRCLGQCVITRY